MPCLTSYLPTSPDWHVSSVADIPLLSYPVLSLGSVIHSDLSRGVALYPTSCPVTLALVLECDVSISVIQNLSWMGIGSIECAYVILDMHSHECPLSYDRGLV